MEPIDEKSYRYPIVWETCLCNEKGQLTPTAYQKITTQVMEEHLLNIHMDVPSLIREYGMAWVLLYMGLERRREIRPEEPLYAQTWCSGKTIPLYRREIVICDQDDAVVAVGASFSSLLDLRRRRICRDEAIHAHFDMPIGEQLMKAQSRFPVRNMAFTPLEDRRVRPSWIDGLGHVNNYRYGELAYDALPEEEQLSMDRLRRMDVWFQSELRRGDHFTMGEAKLPGGEHVCSAMRSDGKPAFYMSFHFAGKPVEDCGTAH